MLTSRTNPDFYGEVAVNGGQLLAFREASPTRSGNNKFNVGAAADDAKTWLNSQGFPAVMESGSHVLDQEAHFVWTPVVNGAAELDHNITVAVNLINGKIVGYNAAAAILDPVGTLPPRQYTAAELKKRLNPAFQVHETQLTVTKVPEGSFTPAVSFYGEYQGQPYRVDMNAQSGHEINISRLPTS